VSAEPLGAASDDVTDGSGLGSAQAQAWRVVAQDVGDLMAAGLFGDDGRGGHDLLLVRRRLRLPQAVERARRGVDVGPGDVGVDLRGGEGLMAEESLDHADVGAALEQVRGEGVARSETTRPWRCRRARRRR